MGDEPQSTTRVAADEQALGKVLRVRAPLGARGPGAVAVVPRRPEHGKDAMSGRAKPGVEPKGWDYRSAALFDPKVMDAKVMQLRADGVGPLSIAVRCGIDHARVLAILARMGDEAARQAGRERRGPKPSAVTRFRGTGGARKVEGGKR